MFRLLFGAVISQGGSEWLHVRNANLLRESNNCCFGGAVQRRLSKLITWRGTATSFRALVKFHRGLRVTGVFARISFAKKKLSENFTKRAPF